MIDALNLIDKWLKQGAHSSSLFGGSRGISQGSILSPLFCNVYLHAFDQALSHVHIPFVRFADDFLLFADRQDKAERALEFAQQHLERLGLSLNPAKTQVVQSHPSVVFLGEPLPTSKG